jgi:hypothetical protein
MLHFLSGDAYGAPTCSIITSLPTHSLTTLLPIAPHQHITSHRISQPSILLLIILVESLFAQLLSVMSSQSTELFAEGE